MTAYLTDTSDAADLIAGHRDGVLTAVKLYPANATTNSAAGVTDIARVMPVLEAMAAAGMPLLIHGEVTDPDVDIFDREAVFIDRILAPLAARLPDLRIVFEHITTAEAAAFVTAAGPNVAATITPHHLHHSRNAMFAGGIRPHLYCLPVLKREHHRHGAGRGGDVGQSEVLPRHRFRPARRRYQGGGVRLRRRVQRAVRDRKLCRRLRRGGRARPAGGVRQPPRPGVLPPAGQCRRR